MANLLETAIRAETFKRLLTAIEAADLDEILQGDGPFTILAPTDEAFANLPDGVNGLLQDLSNLKKIVTYHVLFGDVRSDDLIQIDEAPTFEGSVVAVDHRDGIRVNDAKVTRFDILADNGVIHAIDTVLIPAMVAGHS